MWTAVIVIGFVPRFFSATVTVPPLGKPTDVICNCSVTINPMVNEPIQVATARLTATVTAISMIEAITGLSAFLLRRKFLILLFFTSMIIDVG
jgi:hypothetical protein